MPRPSKPARLDKPFIVIFEERAHLRAGHFSNAFADLADGFCAAGCDVEVVMPLPWARRNEGPPQWRETTYGPVLASAFRTVLWARDCLPFGRVGAATRKVARSLLAQAAITQAIRRRGRQPLGVVFFASEFLDPRLLERLGASRRQIVHDISRTDLQRLRHPPMRSATDGSGTGTVWAQSSASWLSEEVAQRLGSKTTTRLDICCTRNISTRRAEARKELGLSADANVALLFGAGHPAQRPEVVFDALREMQDWQLVIGGDIARAFEAERIEDWRCAPVVRSGYQSEPDRERLLAACDLVIISTTPTFLRDSGVLTDAISHRKPVIATNGSSPGARVHALGIGETFEAGSLDSLQAAVRSIDPDRTARALEVAAERYSGQSLAAEHLSIFEWLRDGKSGPLPGRTP